MNARWVIVGAGQAAVQAIQTMRWNGFEGAITMVGAEPHWPYQRPPLSKGYLARTISDTKLPLRAESFYTEQQVELRLGVRATALDPGQRRLSLDDGTMLRYDRLLLATGSRPRRLDLRGAELAGVHMLRTRDDVDAILQELIPGKQLVLVGGGYIGLEVAAVAVKAGLVVTVLEAAQQVMARAVGVAVSRAYERYHAEQGVRVRCGVGVRALHGAERVKAAETTAGDRIPCDVVIVCVGAVPNVELAQAAGLACADGIVVDACARTADPNVVAAGDCTSQPWPALGCRVRLESVHNAVEQGKAAALALMDRPAPPRTVPCFWSNQGEMSLQIAGISRSHDLVVERGDPQTRSFSVFYLKAGRVVAVDAINRPLDFALGKQLVRGAVSVPATDLADSRVDLAEWIPAAVS